MLLCTLAHKARGCKYFWPFLSKFSIECINIIKKNNDYITADTSSITSVRQKAAYIPWTGYNLLAISKKTNETKAIKKPIFYLTATHTGGFTAYASHKAKKKKKQKKKKKKKQQQKTQQPILIFSS